MNEDLKKFKILSIDGGGIKGLYSSTILEHLEEEAGSSLSNHFDLICGTSTGGLIALGISQKIPMKEISKIYTNFGREIFPERKFRPLQWFEERFLGGKFFFEQTFGSGKYSSESLERVLTEIFGDKTIGESHNLLCIPSYSMTEGKPWVFKYDHSGLPGRDNNTTYVDVALATSAAPTYFPIKRIENYNSNLLIDGGVWANNPALCGVIEAFKYFVGPDKDYNSIEILSVSSLEKSSGKPPNWKLDRSFIGWRSDLIETSLRGQSYFTNYFLESLSNINDFPIKYLRIPTADISSAQEKFIDLDTATSDSINLIAGKGNAIGITLKQNSEVIDIVKSFKSYKTV